MTTDDTQDEEETGGVSRRDVVAGAGLAAATSAGYFLGVGSAAASPSGEIGTASNPYQRAFIDRQRYVGRTSDVSSPDDGMTWYREDL